MTANTWTAVASLPSARDDLGAETGPDGQIYTIGGYDGTAAVAETDAYNTTTNTWSVVASLPTATQAPGAAVGLNGLIYSSGGNTSAGISSAAYAYSALGPDVGDSTSSITVQMATPTVSWANPATITYLTPLGGSQLDATASVPGTFAYTPDAGTVLPAGTGEVLSVTFTPTDTVNYNSVTTTVLINVLQATPTITWANPANITYGTTLSATQLDATASTAGSYVYSPAAGDLIGAGNGQTLSVTFTPTDTADYLTSTATVTINVLKATPGITWATPADITYGTALSGTQLDATSGGGRQFRVFSGFRDGSFGW